MKLQLDSSKIADAASIVLVADDGSETRIPMGIREAKAQETVYTVDIFAPQKPGILWYYFEIALDGTVYYYGNNEGYFGGVGKIYSSKPPCYQITVYKEDAGTPDWFKKSVMYQIFVDRFYNGSKDGKVLNPKKNSFLYASWDDTPMYIKDCEKGSISRWDFFGGNLRGVIEKLDYLKELGVDAIYLNPIFESPSNHKYDTGDYKKIDPMFGSNEVFGELCAKAGKLGISIILDGVFSHTGSDSIYFNKYGNYPGTGAYQSPESPYYKWYSFKGCRDSYECWWGIESLPNVNEMDPGYIDFIITGKDSVIKHWIRQGAKGWRLDVADELPDEFIALIRKTIKVEDPDSVLLGEVWEDASNKISYGKRRSYLMGEELDSVMNYPFRSIMIDFLTNRRDAANAREAFMKIYENYPLHNFYCNMNLIGTHDVARILTILGDAPAEEGMLLREKERYRLSESQKQLAVARLKLMTLVQMTFPGVPSVYYGDEAGVEGYSDPLNRRTYPWGKENMELIEWFRMTIRLRKRYDIFSTGKWIPIYAEGDVLGYIRKIDNGRDMFGNPAHNNTAVVLVNSSKDAERQVQVNIGQWFCGTMYDFLERNRAFEVKDGILNAGLKPLQGRVLIAKPL
ncbi:MAG: glycoside hydrolase family 13 protein [Caulobacteraceae bacterium]